MGTGGGTPGTKFYLPQFSEGILRSIVNEAERTGRITAIHSGATEATRRAVIAGVDLVVHGHFYEPNGTLVFDEEVATMLVESGTAVNPTLWVNGSRAEALATQAEEECNLELRERADFLSSRYADQQENIAKLFELGAKPWAGSDSSWAYMPFGTGLIDELIAMQKVGLSAEQVLQSSTAEIADRLNRPDLGRVRAGVQADIIGVSGNH